MSYIRSKDTYAYPDGDGGLVIHTNHCTDQRSANIGDTRYAANYRYLIQIPTAEFRAMVRRILDEHRPDWVTDKMIDEWMQRRRLADEEF